MLEKIICVDNVGVIKNGTPKAVDLQKVVLIYADNARGKSTLSSLLLACSDANVLDVVSRRTIGATTAQKVVLRFNPPSGTGAYNSEFDGIAWRGDKPNLHVFNQSFVERNVYASTGVLPEQREALLTLALGDAAVGERTKFEKQAALQKDCAGKVTSAEAALVGFRGNYTLDQFMALTPLGEVDKQLADIDKQIGEARAANQIARRPEFKTVVVPVFNFEELSEVVASSFESLSVKAEEVAKAHFEKHNAANTERWVSEGLNHKPDEECPFCGQQTGGLELLKAYKAYFDGSYSAHLNRVSNLRGSIGGRLGDRQFLTWTVSAQFNQGLFNVWAESLGIKEFPRLDLAKAETALEAVKTKLLLLADAKEKNPLAALDPSPFAIAMTVLAVVVNMATDYNAEITKLNDQVAAYKTKFAKPDEAALITQRSLLVIRKNRYDVKTVYLVDAVTKARADYKAAETAKELARTELDKLRI